MRLMIRPLCPDVSTKRVPRRATRPDPHQHPSKHARPAHKKLRPVRNHKNSHILRWTQVVGSMSAHQLCCLNLSIQSEADSVIATEPAVRVIVREWSGIESLSRAIMLTWACHAAASRAPDRADTFAWQKLMGLYVDMMRDSGISAPMPLYVASGLLTYMQPDGK